MVRKFRTKAAGSRRRPFLLLSSREEMALD
jgi:hypothetical protein